MDYANIRFKIQVLIDGSPVIEQPVHGWRCRGTKEMLHPCLICLPSHLFGSPS